MLFQLSGLTAHVKAPVELPSTILIIEIHKCMSYIICFEKEPGNLWQRRFDLSSSKDTFYTDNITFSKKESDNVTLQQVCYISRLFSVAIW